MNRLFLDANVLFTAAHNPGGKAAFLIQAATQGLWQVVTCGYALEEVRRNLQRKFPDRLPELERLIERVEQVPAVRGDRCLLALREKDKPILQAALACGASHLLTGDRRDFGAFMNAPEVAEGLIVQTVADYLRTVQARPEGAVEGR